MGADAVNRAIVPVVLVTLFIVGLQLSIFTTLRFYGVVVMLVWLWPLCVGLAGFTELSMVSAIVSGVFFDTHATTPFGLTAAVGILLAYGASRLGREGVGDLDSAAWWVTPLLAASGGFIAPLVYVAGGFVMFNFSLWRASLFSMMVVNGVAFFVLARPVARLARFVGNAGVKVRR